MTGSSRNQWIRSHQCRSGAAYAATRVAIAQLSRVGEYPIRAVFSRAACDNSCEPKPTKNAEANLAVAEVPAL